MTLYFLLLARVRANPDPHGLWWRLWATWSFILAAQKHLGRRNPAVALWQLSAAAAMLLRGRTTWTPT